MDPLRTNSQASIGLLIGMAVVAPAETPPAEAVAAAVTGVLEPAVVPAQVVRENVSPLNMDDDSTIPKNLRSHLNKKAGSKWSPVKTDDGRRQKQQIQNMHRMRSLGLCLHSLFLIIKCGFRRNYQQQRSL